MAHVFPTIPKPRMTELIFTARFVERGEYVSPADVVTTLRRIADEIDGGQYERKSMDQESGYSTWGGSWSLEEE